MPGLEKVIVLEDLPLKCDCGCMEIEHRNIRTDDIDGISVEVEYRLYCKKCGEYLGSFAVNSRSCGITRVAFEKLDKEFDIMDRFSRQKRSCASSNFFSC